MVLATVKKTLQKGNWQHAKHVVKMLFETSKNITKKLFEALKKRFKKVICNIQKT